MKKAFVILLLLFSTSICFSQDDPGGGFDPGDTGGEMTPIDDGAGVFAGAIVIMGAYMLYRKKKNVK